MGVYRRRDMGQDYRVGTEPSGGQGLRQGAGPHRQRLRRRVRRVPHRPGGVRQPHEGPQDRGSQETYWTGNAE